METGADRSKALDEFAGKRKKKLWDRIRKFVLPSIRVEKNSDFKGRRHMEILEKIKARMDSIKTTYPYERSQNANWRTFSKYSSKPGIDLYFSISMVDLLIMVYLFLFYTKMENADPLGSSKTFQFDSFNELMLFFLI
jgi:hypothetical protein